MASGRFDRNTAPTSATDTRAAAEQGEADGDRLGDAVEHHADGEVARRGGVGAARQRGVTADVLGLLHRLLGVLAFGAPVEPAW